MWQPRRRATNLCFHQAISRCGFILLLPGVAMSISTASDNHDSNQGVLDDVEQSAPGMPTCDQCSAEIDTNTALVCRSCGWYASIGSFVEIDQNWEQGTDVEPAEPAAFRMPNWAWVMIGCVVAVVCESIAARIYTPSGSAERTAWSVTQLFVGAAAVATCHFIAFIMFTRDVTDAGLLDIILKPVKPWIRRVHELPSYQWVCHAAVSGATAVVMALAVIGGIPYERLWDWGFDKPVKQNLMGAIMEQAKKVDGSEKPLEEAVQDFAGKSGDVEQKDAPKKSKTSEPQERQTDDCLIIGYRVNSEGLVYTLLLAGEHLGKLQYVGQVAPRLSVKELRDLGEQLAAHTAYEPFVKMPMEAATWVKPKFTCRVTYARKGKKGGLYDIKLESFLGEIDATAPSANAGVAPSATDAEARP